MAVKTMLSILLTCLGAVLLFYFGFRAFEQANLYFPDRTLTASPKDIGLSHEDVNIETEDKVKIHGWWAPHGQAKAAVLYLHGNGGNISYRLESLAEFNKLGFSVLIIDYRGYGLSRGRPSERGLYRDASAAYDFLISQKGISGGDVVLFGESLGGAVAADLSARVKVRAVITEGCLSSTIDVAKVIYPFLPARRLISQKFDAAAKLAGVEAPKLIIHSSDDGIIPFSLGEKLFKSAREPKEFYAIRGDHNGARFLEGQAYWDKISSFVGSLPG
ncbi:MAG: alpha/beta hydrolase [Elusimicrobia bacterium]|nr:alpha/beta hydrolase [Elusimicrobiota bacterium]